MVKKYVVFSSLWLADNFIKFFNLSNIIIQCSALVAPAFLDPFLDLRPTVFLTSVRGPMRPSPTIRGSGRTSLKRQDWSLQRPACAVLSVGKRGCFFRRNVPCATDAWNWLITMNAGPILGQDFSNLPELSSRRTLEPQEKTRVSEN